MAGLAPATPINAGEPSDRGPRAKPGDDNVAQRQMTCVSSGGRPLNATDE
jgi:hypothetical protein